MESERQEFDDYDNWKDIFEKEISNAEKCPICQENIPVGSTLAIGQYLICPRCGARLEVVQVKPVVLDWT